MKRRRSITYLTIMRVTLTLGEGEGDRSFEVQGTKRQVSCAEENFDSFTPVRRAQGAAEGRRDPSVGSLQPAKINSSHKYFV